MSETRHAILLNEVRYALRLTQRTARLYRLLGRFFIFAELIAVGILENCFLSAESPHWLILASTFIVGLSSAAILTIDPFEKAVLNERDIKKYAYLEADGLGMDAQQLALALAEARQTDADEIECLRDVAYNDIVRESGHPELAYPLTVRQKFLAMLA